MMKRSIFKLATASAVAAALPLTASAIEAPSWGWTGVVEIEAFHSDVIDPDTFDKSSESDLVLATAFLAAEATFEGGLSAHISMLYEEDDTELDVDEAFVSQEINAFTFTAGQLYLPFGTFPATVINDPLTLELGEIRESALVVETSLSSVNVAAYVFNGDVDPNDDDTVQNYGLRLGLGDIEEGNWAVNLDYISNIADSDGLTQEDDKLILTDTVDGFAVAGNLSAGNLLFGIEYLQTGEFKVDTVNSTAPAVANGAELSAIYFDASMETELFGKPGSVSVAYNQTDEAAGLLPETRCSLGASMAVSEISAFSVEITHDQDYDLSDGGSDESAWGVVFQLAAEI